MADLKKLNEVYNSINLGDFYDTEYCDYAIYRALQRIPNLVDGFAQTQRKAIYTCIDKNIDKKTKVSDLSAIVSLHTKYHHGAGSIESAITNLVPQYNNQVPLLREDGTYGSRSDRDASASRYIESRLYKYSKVIFNSIDNAQFVEEQFVENKKIEPVTMIPIIPLLLINGQSQIGVGFSSDVLPRKLETILDILKGILSGTSSNIPMDIPPYAPLFKGQIVPLDGGNWEYQGIAIEGKSNSIKITEVPPRYTRESYLNVLETLKDSGKIKSYVENINGDEFEIDVKVPSASVWTKTKVADKEKRYQDLLKFLKLTEKKSDNLTVINTKDEIKRYNKVGEILHEYLLYVLGIYKKRKAFLLAQMEEDSKMNKNKIRFIQDVNTDQIILKGRKKAEIFVDLENGNYDKFDDSYDYLLNMRISNLTKEKILDLENDIKVSDEAIEKLAKTPANHIWLEDLKEFEKHLAKGE